MFSPSAVPYLDKRLSANIFGDALELNASNKSCIFFFLPFFFVFVFPPPAAFPATTDFFFCTFFPFDFPAERMEFDGELLERREEEDGDGDEEEEEEDEEEEEGDVAFLRLALLPAVAFLILFEDTTISSSSSFSNSLSLSSELSSEEEPEAARWLARVRRDVEVSLRLQWLKVGRGEYIQDENE